MTQPTALDAIEAAVTAYQQHPNIGFACCSAHPAADAAAALLAEVHRLTAQRKYLIAQLTKQNAESGRGDAALQEFLTAEPDDCPGFESNPVAPDLCAGCGQSRRWHTPARL